MNEKININRETLAKTLQLIRPALSTQSYIPALQHIRFDGEYATAYNDIAAIMVRAKYDIDGCVPGELFLRALGSFAGENVAIQGLSDKEVKISSGRAHLKLPVMAVKEFPFGAPVLEDAAEIPLDAGIIKGIETCLVNVGNDPTHPATMGVTLETEADGRPTLYTTDNFTISRYQVGGSTKIQLPGDSPVIMPTFFCQQLVTLARAFKDEKITLLILADALVVEFGRVALLFHKVMADLEPLNFPKVVKKTIGDKFSAKSLVPLPSAWEGAFQRALLVLEASPDKVSEVTVDAETIAVKTSSQIGDSNDSMPVDGDLVHGRYHLDPSLVLRGSKLCAAVAFTDGGLVLSDSKNFLHIIAYCK